MNKLIVIAAVLGLFSTAVGCGRKGDTGAVGATGATGNNGDDGSSCSAEPLAIGSLNAPNGGSIVTCTNGTSAVIINGATGPRGWGGSPGTVITAVNLCPGTTTYPSTFTEIAVCFNNKLYAVYSQNGGFMVELVAGAYTSSGINSSCNFNVGANCSITH